MKNKRAGFTLIELLIVVAIIGILAVALVPSISGAPAKARDAARKVFVQNVVNAVEQYNLDTGSYPSGEGCLNSSVGGDLGTLVSTYLKGQPPQFANVQSAGVAANCPGNVYYTRLANGYVVFAPLELIQTTPVQYEHSKLLLLTAGNSTITNAVAATLDVGQVDYAIAVIN